MQRHRPQTFRINRRAPLANGLVFAGLGGGASSLLYADASGYGKNGTLTNMAPATDWVFDPTLGRFAISGNGATGNKHVVIPSTPAAASTVGTLAIWACISSAYTLDDFGLFGSEAAAEQYWLDYETGPTWRIGTTASGVEYATTKGNWLDTWKHIAYVADGTNIYAYLNGVLDGTFAGIDNIAQINRVGMCQASTSKPFRGFISDPLIYGRALSSSEIQQLADPSNVMLSGLILPPRRVLWPVSSGGAVVPYWMWSRQQTTKVLGGGI